MQGQASQQWGGQRSKAPNTLGRSIRYLGRQRSPALLAYGALIVATLAQLAVPQLIQNMINSVTEGTVANSIMSTVKIPLAQDLALAAAAKQVGTTVDVLKSAAVNAQTWLIDALVIIVVFAAVRAMFSFVQAYMSEKMSQGIAFDFRNEIFAKVQRLSFSYHDRNQTGQLMIRATDDVERVRTFIAQGLLLAAQSFLLLIATLIILFATNWRLTLVVLPILPIALFVFGFFARVTTPLFMEIQKRLSTLNTVLQENLAGIKVVRAFAREKFEDDRFGVTNQSYYEQQIKVAQTFSFLFPVIFLIMQVGQAAILYVSGRMIITNDLTLGNYQSFSLYLLYVFFPLGQLGFIVQLMSQAVASSNRIFEILDAQNDVTDKPNAPALPPIDGHVEFKNVTFRYFTSGEPVLHEVSFEAKPGQTIALLGGTGSGKTTIINLIPRFYDASEGQILIDGHDVRDVTLDSLRSQIGIVLQETNLFSGTIRDNIAFGRPDATDEEVIAAAKAAAAHDFITSFPQGYHTPVGERGTTLSGGQKQRVAIARALLLNPRLLILDDSTSSVDLITESLIQKALDTLMKDRTSFVIAQRITTVLNADLILVLDKGKIVASGKHTDLMENSALYAEIYNSQLVGDAPVDQPAVTQEAK